MGIKNRLQHFILPPLLVVLLTFGGPVNAQTSSMNYPVQFSQFIFSYPMINPASTGVTNNNSISLGYQKPVSGFTGISTYYFNLCFVPYRTERAKTNKSIIGARFFNDNEGAFINRSRFYLTYAFHTALTGNLKLSGGIDLGAMNFTVKATPTTEGASVYRIDAGSGVWLYNDRFHAGISVGQIFRSVFQPLDERIILPAYISISGSYAIIDRDEVIIRPHLLVTYPYYSTANIQASVYGLFFDRLIAVAGLNYGRNVSFMFGLNDIQIFSNGLDIILSYSTTVHKASLSITRLEVSINYEF